MGHTLILGGGIAGLTLACELRAHDEQVTLLEKGKVVGGLARTFARDGFRFDIGGHRFHSTNPEVVRWIQNLLGADLLTVPRVSHIYLGEKFVDYPLRFPGVLGIFNPWQALRMASSYAAAQLQRNGKDDVSFEDWVVHRFGRGLYEIYFKPYTEKVWGIPCTTLSAEWASRRISLPSLTAAVRETLHPSPVPAATAITQFYYPRYGYGMICETLAAQATRDGARIVLAADLRELLPLGDGPHARFRATFVADGAAQILEVDRVVSTIPLNALLAAIPPTLGSAEVAAQYRLSYRDLVCLFVGLSQRRVSGDSWTYFPDASILFGRTHEPKNWSADMVPSPDVTSMAFEIFSSAGELAWALSDDELLSRTMDVTERLGWIRRSAVTHHWVLRVRNAYPVYDLDYQGKLGKVRDYLGRWPNLHLVGRTGSFKYMNADGVVEDCFALMAQLYGERARVASLPDETERWA